MRVADGATPKKTRGLFMGFALCENGYEDLSVFGEVAKFSEWAQRQLLLPHTIFICRRLTLNYDRKACQNILS